MPTASAFLIIFLVVTFITGSAFGALVLLVISIRRTRRTSLFEVSGEQQGATSRSVLVCTRLNRKGSSEW